MFNRIKAKLFAASLSIAGLTLGAIFTFGPVSAGAFETWSEDDPIISVNGQLVSVVVGIPTSQVDNLAGPIQFTFHVPVNVDASIVYVGNKLPEKATIIKDQERWDGQDRIDIPVNVLATSQGADFSGYVKVTDNTGKTRTEELRTGQVLHTKTSVKMPKSATAGSQAGPDY